jgi:hypothetical protein
MTARSGIYWHGHPKLPGDLVSRPAADVMREAERLVAAG